MAEVVEPARPGSLTDAARLAFGTLSVVPVAPPRTVDRRSASWAMVLAPAVGLALAAAAVALQWLLGWSPWTVTEAMGRLGLDLRPAPPLLLAALTVGLLAGLTRGIHLDGLADTADGLGSGRHAAEAVEVMRRGDIGPFGVVTLLVTVLAQVFALADQLSVDRGPEAVALALVVSRLVLPLACSRGVPAARPDGLGSAVAGTVGRGQLVLALVAAVVVSGGLVLLLGPASLLSTSTLLVATAVAAVALAVGGLFCWRCVRRFGGITGDVLGGCVEVTFTTVLVLLTLV